MNTRPLRQRIAEFIFPPLGGNGKGGFASIEARVDDSPGWRLDTGHPHERDQSEIQTLYDDALTAYRKNPIAWRIINTTTNYVVGDKLTVTSQRFQLQKFINAFWNHPKNTMDLRLPGMSDELARAGDLFVALFRNPEDGMSYVRFVTKDRIIKIESAENDWENEQIYYEQQEIGEPRAWYAPSHPDAPSQDSVMLHYAVNRPLGALLGESDLVTMLPWMQRYSRMLEDRVRLHWAVRAFLWIVTVPSNMVSQKAAQYRTPPESGSIIVKDSGESWEAVAPNLRAADASHDLQAIRQMIDAGSGYPPHWRGDPGDANLATATAMQIPTERNLTRRQRYFSYMVQDIVFHAYQRAVEIGRARPIPNPDYEKLFVVTAPDVSRSDNEALSRAAGEIAGAMQTLSGLLPGRSRTLERLSTEQIFRFAGDPQRDETLDTILTEAEANPRPQQPAVVGEEEKGKDNDQ